MRLDLSLKIILTLIVVCGLLSCNSNYAFKTDSAPENSKAVDPVNPQPEPPPGPQPPPGPKPPPPGGGELQKQSGTCSFSRPETLNSCVQCAGPKPRDTEPELSEKTHQLLKIMVLSCAVKNGSDPAGYVPPTKEQILKWMNRCDAQVYPNSSPTEIEGQTVEGLLSSAEFREKIFGGLWFKPPYSTAFETYFGLETKEARYMYCYQTGVIKGTLYDITYYQDRRGEPYRMPKNYVQANSFREGLKSCGKLSQSEPFIPTPAEPEQACIYETLVGNAEEEMLNQTEKWLATGWTIGAEILEKNQCLPIRKKSDLDGLSGELKIAAFRCD